MSDSSNSGYDGRDEDEPSLLERAVAAVRGYPSGWVIDKKLTPEHWAEGSTNFFGDNAGPLYGGALLPARRVLVIHTDEQQGCCTPADYTVKHVEYFNVQHSTFDAFEVGDAVLTEDHIIDMD